MKMNSLLLVATALLCAAVASAYDCEGRISRSISVATMKRGACCVSTHSFHSPIDQSAVTFKEPQEVKEWHFHVYFFQSNNVSVTAANNLRNQLLELVQNHYLVAVFHGVTSEMLPGLDETQIPPVNMGPIGPHPCGSFEVWVPVEYVGKALSFFMLNHGELSVLIHPLTSHELEDHVGRYTFLGPPFRIDVSILSNDDIDTPEYPELQLGYNAPANSQQNYGCNGQAVSAYAPCKWAKQF